MGKRQQVQFQNIADKLYNPADKAVIKSLEFLVQDREFRVNFEEENLSTKKRRLQSMVRALDISSISRDGYRHIAALEPQLLREHAVSDERQKINADMACAIPINLIDLEPNVQLDPSEGPDITDLEIIEQMVKVIGKGAHRSVKKLLTYVVPAYIQKGNYKTMVKGIGKGAHHSRKITYLCRALQKGKLDPLSPIIHLRISGDGRNVGRKVKHVMITVAFLDDSAELFKSHSHYTTVLFPGTEDYTTLRVAADAFIQELQELEKDGLFIDGVWWKFDLYFSSDWKFLAICLGFNAANSNHFCPWCTISKNQRGQRIEWTISKSMNILNLNPIAYPGHNLPPLFGMIPLTNYVPDKLHIMLRITDRLWELALQEIKNEDLFNDITRNIIIKEMKKLKIRFEFWKIRDNGLWDYTSLMGDDKLRVLRYFDLSVLFASERATLIRRLWNGFAKLYDIMGSSTTDP